MKYADLHSHTTCSDGALAPAALVAAAAHAGLAALAITDHDTVAGIAPAQAAGKTHNLEVLAGVELTTRVGPHEVHILGYFPGAVGDTLAPILAFAREIRHQRLARIVAALNQLGIALRLDDVLDVASGADALGRPHVARALARQGVVDSEDEAFRRFLAPGKPAYIERYRMTAAEGIGQIARAGGVAVLAHPGIARVTDADIRELRDQGLRGIEVWHPEHSPTQTDHYRQLAGDLHLCLTGGSDAHNDQPGIVRIPYELLAQLR